MVSPITATTTAMPNPMSLWKYGLRVANELEAIFESGQKGRRLSRRTSSSGYGVRLHRFQATSDESGLCRWMLLVLTR